MAAADDYLIGNWRFDIEEGALRDGGSTRPLEDRAARTLAVLCRRRGEIVSRDELLAQVWQGRTVSANSVAIVIGDLRRALDDDARNPAHIVTVARRGYRLNTEPQQPPDAPEPERSKPQEHSRRPYLQMIAAGMSLLLVLAVVGLSRHSSHPQELTVEPASNDTGLASYQPLANALSAVVTDRVMRIDAIRMVLSEARPSAPGGAEGLRMTSRLILWNGSPELALRITDSRTGIVIWSAFAAGPAAGLARSTSLRLDELDHKLEQEGRFHLK